MQLNITNNKYLTIWLEQWQSLKYWRNIAHIILCLKYTEELGTLRGFEIKENRYSNLYHHWDLQFVSSMKTNATVNFAL